jgi:hypothetical protein
MAHIHQAEETVPRKFQEKKEAASSSGFKEESLPFYRDGGLFTFRGEVKPR